jgi:hypothetical protein
MLASAPPFEKGGRGYGGMLLLKSFGPLFMISNDTSVSSNVKPTLETWCHTYQKVPDQAGAVMNMVQRDKLNWKDLENLVREEEMEPVWMGIPTHSLPKD